MIMAIGAYVSLVKAAAVSDELYSIPDSHVEESRSNDLNPTLTSSDSFFLWCRSKNLNVVQSGITS